MHSWHGSILGDTDDLVVIKVRPAVALLGADDLEVLVDEDVVGSIDADVVDLVLAIAQLHNSVDDSPRVRGQGSFRRLSCRRSAND